MRDENSRERHDDLIPIPNLISRLGVIILLIMLWLAAVFGIGFVLGVWDA